jgi:hypothetical protein
VAFRRAAIRPSQRFLQTQTHLPRYHHRNGYIHIPNWAAADIRAHRVARFSSAGDTPPALGHCGQRWIRQRRNVPIKARAPNPARLCETLDPDDLDGRGGSCSDHHNRQRPPDGPNSVFAVGLAHSISRHGRPVGVLSLHPLETERIADLPKDKAGRKGLKARLTNSLSRYPRREAGSEARWPLQDLAGGGQGVGL